MTVAELEAAYRHATLCAQSARNTGCGTLEVNEYERIADSLWGQMWAQRNAAKHNDRKEG